MPNEKLVTPKYPNLPLFGRKWKVSVLVPIDESTVSIDAGNYTAYVLSDSDYEDQSLRVTFSIQKHLNVIPNFSEISVYNLGPKTELTLIKSGARVQVEAGYVNGNFGVIYDGAIFQPKWEIEDNVTRKVTFKCIDGMDIIYNNNVSAACPAMMYQKDMVLQMCKAARKPFNITYFSENLINNRPSKPKVYFDKPTWYLRKYAQQSGTTLTVVNGQAGIQRPQDIILAGNATTSALKLTPEDGGLIGWPQQTQDGVDITCLLNPNIDVFWPCMLVQIPTKLIRQAEFMYMQDPLAKLDEQSMYKVAGVNHVGDTRGQEWYTKIMGFDQAMEGQLATTFEGQMDSVS